MRIEELDYHLPEELIAQHPAAKRDHSRLMVVDRAAETIAHHRFDDLPKFLRAPDILALNTTRVRASRIFLTRASTGGRVEIFILEQVAEGRFAALSKAGGKLLTGEILIDASGQLKVELLESRGGGIWLLDIEVAGSPAGFDELEQFGRMPLPPYIRREREGDDFAHEDRERYQTVYACESGAVAAPTAGLHFTPEILARLEAAGIESVPLTLHVGLGTFRPVTSEIVEDHPMHAERFVISQASANALNQARAKGGRIVAVGSTSTRSLESSVDDGGQVLASGGATSLMILPGYRFRAADVMLTNFHLPRSTLMALVMAFASPELIRAAYRAAVEERYRFFSYGDAMLIL